ncbi:serine/threonine-protein kinase MRCK alpha-like protein [Willisornis vidua]|uniref:Serine/threonine-protein kinase MRCK alpha-like protein n=1 Tax=Willisornis vidua TaxID=1566151 RepID=A0ABQ9D8E4_9PASS|nr:serine/threonine-protein kinase MRCK alpha-like protein [Willisornis vidua]
MSASSGLAARSSAQNGSALRREFSGGSYGAKRQPMASPSDGSLSSGGLDQGSDAPTRDYEREDSDSPRHSTASNSSNLSSPPSPISPHKTKSLSLESSDHLLIHISQMSALRPKLALAGFAVTVATKNLED